MIQATRWRQDTQLQPTNPYQRIRFYATFPSGGQGDSAFAWSPVLDAHDPGGIVPVGSPDGFSPYPGISGASGFGGLGIFDRLKGWLCNTPSSSVGSAYGLGALEVSNVFKGIVAIGGIAFGAWLAKKNLEG